MLIKKAWKCLGYIVHYFQRRQHSMDTWWKREKEMLYLDANWLIFFFLSAPSWPYLCIQSGVSYTFMIMHNYKNNFWLILKLIFLFRQFASDIIDGSAVLFLSQCPKFTDLFLLNFWLFFFPLLLYNAN